MAGALFAVTAPGPVRDAALSLSTQFDVGRYATGSVDVRRLPGDGVEMLLITPAVGPFDFASRLPGVTVFSDCWQDDRGTCLLVRVQPGNDAPDLPFGVIERPLAGAPFSGDTWALSAAPEALTLMVIDGLGHGPLAQNAATAAVEALRDMAPVSPSEDLRTVHDALKGTVGAAGAVARIDPERKSVDFCGLGNIDAALVFDDRRSGLASYPGVAGQGSPTFRTYRHVVANKCRLVMHTDGIRANWSPAKYPGLFQRHPALIAAVLFRDCWRQSDDALIVVIDVSPKTQTVLAALSL